MNNQETAKNSTVAQQNYDAAIAESPWLANLADAAERVVLENSSVRSKQGQLTKLVDRALVALSPHVACRRGCNFCCHIPVMIFRSEADRIAAHIGRPAAAVPMESPDRIEARSKQFYRVPCVFLKEGECSIYEVRPLVCRQHHSLDATPEQCNVDVPEEQSRVPSMGHLQDVQAAFAVVSMEKESLGDIREFFPGP